MKWLSTVRARAGFTVNNNWLVYGTGGIAYAKVQNSFNFGDPGALTFVNNKSVSKTLTGWVAGGGIEYMVSPKFIVGAEALYVGLPSSSVVQTNPGNTTKTTTFKNSVVISRLKADYKF
jgi:outer membrane immunogenic protein